MSCAEARMEVLLAAAGRAVAVVVTDGVCAGTGVLAAASGVEGSRGGGVAAVGAGEGAVVRASSRYEVRGGCIGVILAEGTPQWWYVPERR